MFVHKHNICNNSHIRNNQNDNHNERKKSLNTYIYIYMIQRRRQFGETGGFSFPKIFARKFTYFVT